MTSLSDTAKAAMELQELSGRLHAEIMKGKGDFASFVALADTISEKADVLAGAFHEADRLLTRLLDGDEHARTETVSTDAETVDEPSADGDVVSELRDITTRLHELEQRLEERGAREQEAGGEPTVSEFDPASTDVEPGAARENGGAISQPASRESGNGSHAYDHLTREQLYTWAQNVDVAGRSRMSKEELIEALGGRERES